jgi:hypothetical protein
MMRPTLLIGLTLLSAIFSPALGRAADDATGYGGLSGQFVFDGDAPKPGLLVKAAGAVPDVPDERLLVDPETKRIANVCIYLEKAPAIHPDLKAVPEKAELVFKDYRLAPHITLLRTGQKLVARNLDPVAHNIHPYMARNTSSSHVLAPGGDVGITYASRESLPLPIKSDIYPFLSGHLLVLDHPYAAITDAQGKFRIDKLPAGEHKFSVWHERAGRIDRAFRVVVEKEKTTEVPVQKIDPRKFATEQ